MRKIAALVPIFASIALTLTGCLAVGGGTTITGTLSADYFDLTSGVAMTFTREGTSYSIQVPMVGSYIQVGSYVVMSIPAGTYSIEATFEASHNTIIGTTYRRNGGTWGPVDGEFVTGTSSPFTFTITIDSLSVGADETIDIYFGDGELAALRGQQKG